MARHSFSSQTYIHVAPALLTVRATKDGQSALQALSKLDDSRVIIRTVVWWKEKLLHSPGMELDHTLLNTQLLIGLRLLWDLLNTSE